MGLGMAHVGKGDAAVALSIFDQLVVMRPTATAYYGRAMAHAVAANKSAGLRDVDQAIALEPNNPIYQKLRAQISAQK